MKFLDYFTDNIEYPNNVALDPIPIGILWSYISSTFLNGFINYVTIVKAFVLGRYYAWDEEINYTISVMDPPGSFNWTEKKCKTKDDLYQELVKKKAVFHVNPDYDFQDDVVILAKAGNTEAGICYFYFWYDMDCSDCCIGRFITDDNEENVITSFYDYVTKDLKEFGSNDHGARGIPLHYFQQGGEEDSSLPK